MKIILFLFCICLVAQLQAQHTKDSLNQQKEVLLISPGRSSIQDTSKRKVLRDSIFQQKESNVSELFIIGKKLTKKEKTTLPATILRSKAIGADFIMVL